MNYKKAIKQLEQKSTDLQDNYTTLEKQFKKLKKYEADEMMHTAHNYAFEKIDCLQCANCCKTIPPLIEPEDIKRLAKHLNLTEKEFKKKHITKDEDGDTVLNVVPCIFLNKDNTCSIYHIRPKACAEYPFTNYTNCKKIFDTYILNAGTCLAVSEVLDQLSEDLLE